MLLGHTATTGSKRNQWGVTGLSQSTDGWKRSRDCSQSIVLILIVSFYTGLEHDNRKHYFAPDLQCKSGYADASVGLGRWGFVLQHIDITGVGIVRVSEDAFAR